jgi:hypothetical protein
VCLCRTTIVLQRFEERVGVNDITGVDKFACVGRFQVVPLGRNDPLIVNAVAARACIRHNRIFNRNLGAVSIVIDISPSVSSAG